MPIDVQMPDGTIISGVPDNITQADLLARYKAYVPPTPQEAVGGARKPEDIGFVERNIGAAKRGVDQLGDITGGLGLAATSLTGTEAETAAKMQQIKREQAVPQETPGYTAADIERIYKKEGLLSAAGAVPSYITEQILQSAPSMAIPLAAGATATAVSSPLGPAAPVIGALVGVGAYGVQQFGNFLTRQAIEKKDAKELDLLKAAGTAAATAPLGYFADRFTAGLGGIGTKKAGEEILKELSARQVAAKVGKRAAGGATAGIIAEAPLEVLEQAAERWQAGLELTGDDAANEYKEAFFGAAAAGAGIGGTSRAIQAYQTPVKPGEKTPPEDTTAPPTTPVEPTAPRAAPPSEAQDTQAMIDEISGLPPAAPPPAPPVEAAPPAAPVAEPNVPQTEEERNKAIEISNGMVATGYVNNILEKAQQGFIKAGQEYEETGSSPSMPKVIDFLRGQLRPLMGSEKADRYIQYLTEEGGLASIENAVNNEYFGDAVNGVSNIVKPISIGTRPPTPPTETPTAAAEPVAEPLAEPAVEPVVEPTTETPSPQQPKTVEDETGEKLSYPMFVDMADKGYKLYSFENPRTYENKGGVRYRTLEKDGVRLAFEPQQVLFTDPKKPNQQPQLGMGNEKDVAFHFLGVDPDVRKQGKARQAIQDLIEIADKNDLTLYGEPAQLEKGGMTKDQLLNFYKQFGFKPTNDTNKVIVREPGAKAKTAAKGPATEVIANETTPELKDFDIAKSKETIHDEIKDLDAEQLSQYLVDNAPNSAARHIAEKILTRVKDLIKAGIPVKIEIKNGPIVYKDVEDLKGNEQAATALGWQQPIIDSTTKKLVYYSIALNGLDKNGKEHRSTGTNYQTIMHEMLHMVTSMQLHLMRERGFKGDKQVHRDLISVRRAVAQKLIEEKAKPIDERSSIFRKLESALDVTGYKDGKPIYGPSSLDELISHGLTDKKIQKFLSTIDMGKKTALQELMAIFRKLIGIDPQYETALDRLILGANVLLDQKPSDINKMLKGFGYTAGKLKSAIGQDQTDTPQFKKFFGKSKVVDEDGSPLLMYHGTANDLFTVFDKEKIRANDYDTPFNGFWFSSNKRTSPAMRDATNTIPVYLSIKNPAPSNVWRKVSNQVYGQQPALRKESRSVGDEVRYRLQDMGYDGIQYDGKPDIDIEEFNKNGQITFKDFSGKTYTIVKDNETGGVDLYDGKVTGKPNTEKDEYITGYLDLNDFLDTTGKDQVWVAFEPTQIKSAVDNTGEFDITDPDITKSTVTEGQKQTQARNYLGEPVEASWAFPEDKFIKVPGAPEQSIDKLLYIFQDKQIDLKRAQQGIAKAAGEITDNINAYDKEQLFHGKVATGIRNFLLNELMPAIKKIKESKLTTKEMQDYLLARHAEERNNRMNELNKLDPRTGEPRKTPWELQDRASGMSTADARKYLADLDPAKKQSLETIGKMFDKMITGTQKILVDSGSESQATIDAWNEAYKHYMPLFRVEEDFNNGENRSGLNKGFNVNNPFSKRAMGSAKEVQNIVNNLIKQRERALIRAEKLNVLKSLYGLFLMNPNPDIALPVNPDAIKDKGALIAELEGLGYKNAAEIANNLMEEPKSRYISKNKVIDKDTGLPTSDTEESVRLRIDSLARFGDDVITLRVDGKNRYIFFNQDNPNAKRMAASLKSLDVESLGSVMSIVAKGTRWFANVNTQYNPIFAAVNLIRDIGSAQFNLTTTPLAGKQAQVTAGIFPAMRGIFKVLRAERGGEVGGDSDMEKAFREFREAGGQTGYRDAIARKESDRSIIDDMLKQKSLSGNALKAMKSVFNALSDFNDTLENSIRLSAYIQASKPKSEGGLGLSKQQAAVIAKNLTVNFDKKGQISANVNALYAFFNASVQGTARLATTLTGPKGKAIIGGGMLAGSMQAILLAAAGFREDEPPEFVKQRNFVIPTPDGNYLTIPYPLGFNLLPNIGRITTEFMISGGKNPAKRAGDLLGSVADAFSPIGSSGLSMQTIAPTVLDPLAALEANKDAFGRPIYKEDRATNPTPGYLRSRENASEMSNAISYFFNLASGGTKYSKGFVSPTADEIDYVIGQVTGGLGREIMKTGQTIKAAGTGEDLPAYRVPLLGRFYGETESNAAESQRFYNNITRMADHENEIKGRIKNKESVASYYRDNPEARLYQQANTIENQINALNKQKKDFIERDLPKDRIKRIENQKALIMKRFNDQLAKFED